MAVKTKAAGTWSIDTDDIQVVVYKDPNTGTIKVRAQGNATNAEGASRYLEIVEDAAAALKTEAQKVVGRLFTGWT
jgi:hypothetical protein